MTDSKFEHLLVLLIEHDWMRRHESTDNNEIFAFGIPAKIMDWAFESLDLIDFPVFVVEYIQTILTVVRLASGVVVGL